MDEGTKIQVSFNNDVKNMNTLTKYEKQLRNIYGYIKGLENPRSKQALDEINKNIEKLTPDLQDSNKETKDLNKNLKSAFKVGSAVALIGTIKKLVQSMAKLSQKSVEYIENVNLLEVAYKNMNETIDESSKRIETYIDKMSEVYGLDESRLTRQFGIFKQLANAMQLPTETAENLSEIMVKMTNDIASLYNLPLNRASNALQSALAGQVRPIRSATGADITEKTLQNTVVDLGLDRTISELSYVEKRLVMVVSLTNQLKNSQGDYARTIESASNQIRIMHEQWDRLSRAVGNVFYPILEKVLPLINGILMALTEVFNVIATLVGFKMPDFDYSGLTGVSDLAIDIEEELGGAGDAVDKLASKLRGLRSFDKLNVINTPKDKSGSASFGSGYVDPKIMDAFNDAFSNYNDMMGEVQMKANKIRDAIMEWLGFTKEVNSETGEISWKFDHLTSGTILGALVVGGSIYNGVSGILGMFTKITGLKAPTWLSSLLGFVAKGTVAIGGGALLGNEISKWLKNFAEENGLESLGTGGKGSSIFDIYLEKDMFSWWSEDIIPYFTKERKETQKALKAMEESVWESRLDFFAEATQLDNEDYINTMKGYIADYVGANGNIIESAKRLKELSPYLDFELGGVFGTEITNIKFRDDIDLSKTPWRSMFGKEDADNVSDYTKALSEYFDLITERTPEISNLKKEMESSNTAISNATQNIQTMLTQMGSEYFTMTEENIQKLNGYFKNLEVATQTSGQAFLDIVTISISKLQEQGYVSDETAQKVIDNAYRKKLAEEGATREYIEAMVDLQKQLKDGKISQEQYYKKAVELHNQFNKNASVTEKYRKSIDIFNKDLKITGENWKEVETATSNASKAHDDATKDINSNMQDTINVYSDWLAQIDTTTEEGKQQYKETTEVIEQLNKQQADSLQELDDAYALYLLNLLDNLENSKEGATKKGKEMKDNIAKELSELGMDVDISKGKENILGQIDGLKSEIESRRPKMTVDVEGNTDPVKEKINGVFRALSQSPLLDLLLPAPVAYGIKYSLGSFLLYDKGGFLPPVGNMFVMNEKGPELLGTIGGKSFVANQNQMMDLLDKKIGNAQNQKNKQVYNIYLDADHLVASYTLDQLQSMAKSNGSSITIG